ncbi:MAG: nickel/cobalt transporter [Hyphomicrobiaceae bacterium]|nr:nickel/cobalt transporter [Hyphomicrobiaceae bacterium]
MPALLHCLARCAASFALLILTLSAPVLAQDAPPQRSPLGITLPSQAQQKSDPAAGETPTPVSQQASTSDRVWAWMLAKQAQYKQSMSASVRDLRTGQSLYPAVLICALAFAYGVIHAAGPGHGKAVISSYVLANERTLRRGIMLSFLSALIQALSAITFVGILAIVLKATSMTMRSAEAWSETLSWAFVALVGAWLLYRQIRLLWQSAPVAVDAKLAPAHGPAHAHAHAHDHAHGPNCSCGHSHAPDARQLDGEMSLAKAFAIAFAVGIRPCTGALTLLFLTLTQGVLWVGILGTFAMALGTAIMVSILACMAIGSRELASRFAGEGSPWGWRLERAAGLTGSSLILLMGTVFFIGSLQQTAPL